MRYLFAALATLFVLLPRVTDDSREIYGLDIFNTAAFSCTADKKPLTAEWVAPENIRIYNAAVWKGATGGAVADIGAIVYRESDKTILFHQNWDHYAEPTGIHTDRLDLAPNYITLNKGDSIQMAYWCQHFNGLPSQAHIIVTIWYSK